ncbi:hypothetical protein K9N68_27790 [Kovacikia minuta CCNUW1]|uniref:hypothetical protein n=1 Tax=Kovacikia minuta TaxID=2931930 RepID=UPI001CD0277A|nr:hypothetical protein [Kovacikia minuta]UBF25368.1 hypothetical protein K9N68_27790 [Kovacikia minuta CCNUW1]
MQKGPGFLPTFLYYFVGTTLIGAIVISQQTGASLATGDPYQASILAGLLAGLSGAYFNRHTTISVPFTNKRAFIQKLKDALSQLGYEEKAKLAETTIYERPGWSNTFSGKLFVEIEPNSATISGRSGKLKALQRRIQD